MFLTRHHTPDNLAAWRPRKTRTRALARCRSREEIPPRSFGNSAPGVPAACSTRALNAAATPPTSYDIRQTTTTLSQRKVNWFGDSPRLLEFDRPLTEPGASKLTKVFLARRTADAVTISTDLGQRRQLVDTRTLERTYVDGDTIKMELVLTTARGDTVRITRYLVRSALPAAPAPAAPPG